VVLIPCMILYSAGLALAYASDSSPCQRNMNNMKLPALKLSRTVHETVQRSSTWQN
jgi:hypothetical protein